MRQPKFQKTSKFWCRQIVRNPLAAGWNQIEVTGRLGVNSVLALVVLARRVVQLVAVAEPPLDLD